MLSTTQPKLDIEAKLFSDNCLVVEIRGKLVGVQDDGEGSDEVEFLIYDDGKVIVKKVISLPINEAKEIDEKIVYKGGISQNSPGIAIESQELGLYIDPLIPTKISLTCQEYQTQERLKKEYERVCNSLAKFGFSCEEDGE